MIDFRLPVLVLSLSVFVAGCSDSRAAYYQSRNMPTSSSGVSFNAEHHELPKQAPASTGGNTISVQTGPRLPSQNMRGNVEIEPSSLHQHGY